MLNTQYQAFLDATKVNSKVKARGSNIREVDIAFKAYWDEIHRAGAVRERQLLGNLVEACSGWLKKKKNKSDYKTKMFGIRTNYINDRFVRRKAEISRLGTEAIKELYSKLLGSGILTADMRGQLHFHKHKLAALGKSVFSPRPELRQLGVSYQPERQSFLASSKTVAISGSGAHEMHKQLNQNLHDLSNVEVGRGDRKTAIALAKKSMDTLSVKDYEILHALGSTGGFTGTVAYLSKQARAEYMVLVDDAGLLIDRDENPITTAQGPITAYAMNEYGTLFVKDASPLAGAKFFNHSSFNAGKDVICAGELTIAAGKLESISNASGHYKPGRTNLHNCLEVLVSDGVDLSAAIVELMVWINGTQEVYQYAAADFVADPDSLRFRIKQA